MANLVEWVMEKQTHICPLGRSGHAAHRGEHAILDMSPLSAISTLYDVQENIADRQLQQTFDGP